MARWTHLSKGCVCVSVCVSLFHGVNLHDFPTLFSIVEAQDADRTHENLPFLVWVLYYSADFAQT